MKLTYHFDSAQEVDREFIESLRATFKNKSIKIFVESDDKTSSLRNNNNNNNINNEEPNKPKISQEMTDAVVEILFDQLLKKKKK